MKHKHPGKYLSAYFDKELHRLGAHMGRAKASQGQKAIHDLRVDIKRLRAVFSLLHELSPKKLDAAEESAPLDPVFKSAGDIREAQVNRSGFANYKFSAPVARQYRQFLKKKEEKAAQKFEKAVGDFDRGQLKHAGKKTGKLCSGMSDREIRTGCLRFVKRAGRDIGHFLTAGSNEAVIHKIRKRIKSLGAVVSLMVKLHPQREYEALQEQVKQAGALIGDWHDRIVLIASLEKFVVQSNKLDVKEVSAIMSILNKIRQGDRYFFEKMKRLVSPMLRGIPALS